MVAFVTVTDVDYGHRDHGRPQRAAELHLVLEPRQIFYFVTFDVCGDAEGDASAGALFKNLLSGTS